MKHDGPICKNFFLIAQLFIFEFLLNKQLWIIDLYLIEKDISHLIVRTLIKNLPNGLVTLHILPFMPLGSVFYSLPTGQSLEKWLRAILLLALIQLDQKIDHGHDIERHRI